MATKKTIETTNDKKDKLSIIEVIQDIDARLTHLEDIQMDNRELIVKLVKQGNIVVQFIKDFQNIKELWKERAVGYERNSSSMFFSWATNVTVDGTDYNVTAEYSGKIDGNNRNVETFTFIYPRGEKIFHDPKIGVSDFLEYTEEKVTEFIELLLSWSSGVGAGLIVIAAIAIRKKPKKFDWED